VIGAHLANGAVTDADLALLHAGGFAGALLRWDHSAEVAHRVRDVAPDAGLVVRLPDSSGTIIPRGAGARVGGDHRAPACRRRDAVSGE
jgi:hypothetical protein